MANDGSMVANPSNVREFLHGLSLEEAWERAVKHKVGVPDLRNAGNIQAVHVVWFIARHLSTSDDAPLFELVKRLLADLAAAWSSAVPRKLEDPGDFGLPGSQLFCCVFRPPLASPAQPRVAICQSQIAPMLGGPANWRLVGVACGTPGV